MPENDKQPTLDPGDVLSYSAGRRDLDPYAFRKVSQDAGRLAGIVAAFPYLDGILGTQFPLIVSCYPATTLGSMPHEVFVDTYLRKVNFSRAMLLAADQHMPTIVIGQPLSFLELLLRLVDSQHPLPRQLIVMLGG